MATRVVRGKALVAKLRADPQVRDADALAAYLGRVKRLKKGGLSTKAAIKAAGKAAKAIAKGAVADGGTSKPSAGDVSKLPKTSKEAARAHVQGLIDAGDERLANDNALQDKVAANFERIFGGSVEKASPEARQVAANAVAANEANPRMTKARKRFGSPAVVVKRHQTADENPDTRDVPSADGQQEGTTTLLFDSPLTRLGDSDVTGPLTPGGDTVDDSTAGVLRHEFGHFVENVAERKGHPIDRRKFRSLLPDGDTMKRDLSFYAGISWKDNNEQEPWAELVSLITHPDYDPDNVPESMRPAARYVEKVLGL